MAPHPSALSHSNAKLLPVEPREADRALLDPATMPNVYGMLMENAFGRRGISAGDAIIIDRRTPPAPGDVVLVYLRADAPPAGLPRRLVAELATSIFDTAFGPGSEVQPLVGLFLGDGAEALFVRQADVLAVHRIDAVRHDLWNPEGSC